MNFPEKPKRRFWQLHLSTMVLMTIAAGFVMLLCLGQNTWPGSARQSEWVEKDGLAARICVNNSKLMPEEPIQITLELKNTSDKRYRVYNRATGWDVIMIKPAIGTDVVKSWAIPSDPKMPSLMDFKILQPNNTVWHAFDISVDSDFVVAAWNARRQFRGNDVLVSVDFTNGDFEPFDMDGNPDNSLLGVPIWQGHLTSATLPLRLALPWTTRRMMQVIGLLMAIVMVTAVVFEFLVRRFETGKP